MEIVELAKKNKQIVDKSKLPQVLKGYVAPEDFEKDDDTNFHVDWITVASNLRAANYQIPPADRLETKRLAGRIIPAVATTTAAVAGLVSLELIKYAKGCELKDHRNSFVNIGVCAFNFAEPAPATLTEIRPGLSISLWDLFDVKAGDLTVRQFIRFFSKKYKIPQESIDAVTQGTQMVWVKFLHGEERMEDNMRKWLATEKDDKFAELLVTAEVTDENGNETEKAVPVRYWLVSSKKKAKKRKREAPTKTEAENKET